MSEVPHIGAAGRSIPLPKPKPNPRMLQTAGRVGEIEVPIATESRAPAKKHRQINSRAPRSADKLLQRVFSNSLKRS